jgi:D-alanyl-D-alanine dipeptidase
MLLFRRGIPVVLACATVACGGADGPAESPRIIGSDSLAAETLVDVRSADSTILVEARYATTNNFTGAVLPGYQAPRVLIHRDLSGALSRANAALRSEGLGLKVFDGYRPVRATLGMVDWAERVGRVDLLDDGYIARRSRHNLGVAIDVTIVDVETGKELDMGTPYDTFDASAHTMNAAGEVLERRLRLKAALESQGFANYAQEWWHYSYPVEGAVPFDRVITEHVGAER